MRRQDGCINCGEVREMAALGLCFKCYRADVRARKAADPLWAKQGNGWLLKEQKKASTVVTNILKSISDCPLIEGDDVRRMQDILRPYLVKLTECFAPKEIVNSEQKFERSPVNGVDAKPATGSAKNNKAAGDSFSAQIQQGEEQ